MIDAKEWYLKNVLSDEPYFVITVDNKYAKRLYRVHTIKQQLVENICKEAQKYTDIVDIIVFGSSITFRCSAVSDLDICVDVPDLKHPIVKYIMDICDHNCDIIINNNITSPTLAYEIANGVKVFERS